MNTSSRALNSILRGLRGLRGLRDLRSLRVLVPALAAIAVSCGGAAHAGGPAPAAKAAKASVDLEIDLDIEVGEPIMLAGKDQKAYVKISLHGFDLPKASKRPPVNLALVLDRSSSMSGAKIERAKAAALMVLDRLGADDVLSIITYDSTVDVLVPATRISNRAAIRERIIALQPRGATALFAGVSYGIEEVSKFLDDSRVNRVILLSDGQANVGPSSPNELGRLGAAAGKQGIAISTIGLGLGYNEDLMTQLAMRSDGNHGFAENADQLASIFNYELGDVLSVVAQDVEIEIEFPGGVRPLRGLNRDVEIHGSKARLSLNQLYAKQEKYFLVEVQVPASRANSARELARVSVGYENMITRERQSLRDRLGVEFSSSRQKVAKSENQGVMVAAVEAIAVKQNREAVALRDQGQVEQARRVLRQNAQNLRKQSKRYKSKRLEQYSEDNFEASENLDEGRWNRQRKSMRKSQHQLDTNQSY